MECRICFGDDHPETMLSPCLCRGTSAYVHDTCLRVYFSYYPDRLCRVCHERMEHPWVDRERNLICASTLLGWASVLLGVSTQPLAVKLLCLAVLAGLLGFHMKYRQLTYETTFSCLVASGFLFLTDPVRLPQMVVLVFLLLIVTTLCIFMPVETILLVIVFSLAITYSVLLTFAVALQTDPAFTGLFLLAMSSFWLVFVRPGRVNALYR